MSKLKRLYGIRGAVGADNTEKDICSAVSEMFDLIFKKNSIDYNDIVSIQFTSTTDLTAYNPAKALRMSDMGECFSNCALFCSAEPTIDGSPKGIIRVLVTAYLENTPVFIYCRGAEKLRPDISQSSKI